MFRRALDRVLLNNVINLMKPYKELQYTYNDYAYATYMKRLITKCGFAMARNASQMYNFLHNKNNFNFQLLRVP